MDAKKEFVELAMKDERNMAELCRRFGISRTLGYRYLDRYVERGEEGLTECSRRPRSSPDKTSEEMERAILELRDQTHWGPRKLRRRLQDLGVTNVPPRSTIGSILKRNGRIEPAESGKHKPFIRFEHEHPNDLWQMDFKGYIVVADRKIHPLTILDDHSRFLIRLQACTNQTTKTVQAALIEVFERYGMPWRINVDNGSPWGDDEQRHPTKLEVWLIRLGVGLSHSRPYHPQTQGKDERLHRSLDDELLRWIQPPNRAALQEEFDRWRERYNHERPHESLADETPVKRYQPSLRSYPAKLPKIEYSLSDVVRKVDSHGKVGFNSHKFRIGKGFAGYPVAIRPNATDGLFDVFFCHQRIRQIDLRKDLDV